MKMDVPEEVVSVAKTLQEAGFEAYLVGGCVRDILLSAARRESVEPKDWDIATNARPEEIQKLFEDNVYENDFGTVLVKTRTDAGDSPRMSAVVEVTTYRIEGKYTDKRHPDEVKFAKTIEEDLSRRDFTINAMAFDAVNVPGVEGVISGSLQQVKRSGKRSDPATATLSLIDPYGGQDDLKKGIIRTVGTPEDRFSEDALRLMRAVRFATELGWEIELNTRRAIEKCSHGLEAIAKERIRDELLKMIMSPNAAKGILLLEELGLLQYVLPELREGLGVDQNKHHVYTIFEHNIRSLDYAAKQNYSFDVRMASLLHDVGKARAKEGIGPESTFYQHEYISAKMAARMLDRLRFSKEAVEKIAHLVRRHMFYYNVGEISDAGVRRFCVRVGPENIDDLLKVREADRIGSGVKKAIPYKLRHLLFMIEKVKHDPLSPKMLKVNGDDIMKILNIPPGPRVGWTLNALLEEVLDDPKKNEKIYLTEKAEDMGALSDEALKKMAIQAREKKDELEAGAEEEMKKKYFVQ
jgi:poly(A) polymerase/tRNA nucleotidyltransferase (CCA-adding enzyme)